MRKITFYLLFIIPIYFASCQDEPGVSEESAEFVYPEFVKEISERISKDPKNDGLFYQRAKELFAGGEDSLAYVDIKTALSLKDDNADYHFLFGNIAFERNEIAEAQTAIKRAIELKPEQKEAYLVLANMQFYLRDLEACNRTLENLSKYYKDLPESYFLFGRIKKEMGDTASAISNFQRTVALDNDHYNAYMQLGILLGEQTDPMGIDYLNNAIRLNPNSTEALYARGLLYQALGNYGKAANDYRQIIDLRPDYAAASYNMGYINFTIGKFELAIEFFNQALIQDSSLYDAYYWRGASYQSLGNNTEAIRNYRECLKMNPEHARAKAMLDRLGG